MMRMRFGIFFLEIIFYDRLLHFTFKTFVQLFSNLNHHTSFSSLSSPYPLSTLFLFFSHSYTTATLLQHLLQRSVGHKPERGILPGQFFVHRRVGLDPVLHLLLLLGIEKHLQLFRPVDTVPGTLGDHI